MTPNATSTMQPASPDHSALHPPNETITTFMAALAAHRAGKLDEAKAGYLQVLTKEPKHPDVLQLLGALSGQEGRYAEAEQYLRAALALQDHAVIHGNLGLVLEKQGRLTEAETSYRKALELKPDYTDVYEKLGNLLRTQGRFPEAETAFRAAWHGKPNNGRVLAKLNFLQRMLCLWDSLTVNEVALAQFAGDGNSHDISPFECLTVASLSPLHQRQVAARFAEQHYGQLLAHAPLHESMAGTRDRLRVGYLSADFHEHATVCLLAGVLESHDKTRFSISLYSHGPETDDAARRRVKNACEVFRDVARLTDEAAARCIAEDKIDILVDLKGYTEDMRLGIVAFRPAPVIVSWLGYPGSLGHPRLADYVIGDPVVTPLDHASHFSEALALLPHCYQPNDRIKTIPPRPTRREAGLPETGFVFCSFNQTFKMDPATFTLWCRLLESVPGSVLWLREPNKTAAANLRREASAQNIDAGRLIFAPLLPHTDHLGRLQLAELVLDTFPYTSHTTGSDALRAGVPIVTRIGDTFASRVAASLLHAAGLPELVTSTSEEYYSLALSLAQNPQTLAVLRDKLTVQRSTCPLFDTKGFTRDLERLYGDIWTRHVHGTRGPVVLTPQD